MGRLLKKWSEICKQMSWFLFQIPYPNSDVLGKGTGVGQLEQAKQTLPRATPGSSWLSPSLRLLISLPPFYKAWSGACAEHTGLMSRQPRDIIGWVSPGCSGEGSTQTGGPGDLDLYLHNWYVLLSPGHASPPHSPKINSCKNQRQYSKGVTSSSPWISLIQVFLQ